MKLKTIDQINRIHDSCRLLSRMFKEIVPLVVEGANLLDLDKWSQDFITRNKAKPAFKGFFNYPATLCTSVNNEVIHGIPRNRKLKTGDLVGLDCGINLNGFISDMALTFPIGKITPKEELLLKVTKDALNAGIAAITPNGRMKDIARAVTGVVKPHGFGIVHQYCGHGVGFDVHEDPQVPNNVGIGPNPKLHPGLVIAVEPMINLGTSNVKVLEDGWTVVTEDGKKSAHFEHTVAVLEDGIRILTLED